MLSNESEDDKASCSKYNTHAVEIKDYNVVIDSKCFFYILVKKIEKVIEMGKKNDHITGNLLDY